MFVRCSGRLGRVHPPPSATTLKRSASPVKEPPRSQRIAAPFRMPMKASRAGRPSWRLATGQALPFATTLLTVALRATKNPTEQVARGGLGGVLSQDLVRRLFHRRTSEPAQRVSIRLPNCRHSAGYAECSARAAAWRAHAGDTRMPTALAAFAGAGMGNDVRVAVMGRLDTCCGLRATAQPSRVRVFRGIARASQERR